MLQHTNVFSEFMPIYSEMKNYNDYQYEWVAGKEKDAIPISGYIHFIAEMKKQSFPINIKFGLEVCYSESNEELIKEILKDYDFDFLTGSIHSIDGWAFSHLKQRWTKDDFDIEHLYNRYYDIMLKLVKSAIFNGLAYPDSLACFGVESVSDLHDKYILLADALLASNMYLEQSSGLAVNYKLNRLGMNKELLAVMQSKGVKILTASDAHRPEDVGTFIEDMQKMFLIG